MLLFSSEIVCFPLRLNWDEKVIQTLSPSAWWLHTTIAPGGGRGSPRKADIGEDPQEKTKERKLGGGGGDVSEAAWLQ